VTLPRPRGRNCITFPRRADRYCNRSVLCVCLSVCLSRNLRCFVTQNRADEVSRAYVNATRQAAVLRWQVHALCNVPLDRYKAYCWPAQRPRRTGVPVHVASVGSSVYRDSRVTKLMFLFSATYATSMTSVRPSVRLSVHL